MRLDVVAAFFSVANPPAYALATTPGARTLSFQGSISSPSTPRLFPLLTWLRDEAIELVFGRPPLKNGNATPLDDLRPRFLDEVVLRFNISTPQEEFALAESTSRLILDVWSFTTEFVDVRIKRERIPLLLALLPSSLHESYHILVSDLATAVHESYPSSTAIAAAQDGPESNGGRAAFYRQADGDNVFFRDYRPLSVIVPWMRLLEAMFPSVAQLISIGKSYEGREIHALKVGVKSAEGSVSKRKTLVVTGGMHAREWISTTTVNYIAWSFITSYGRDSIITKFLDHFDLIFIPVVNPDGVEYTWQVDRLWRKTRQQTNLQFCKGFDLDRAFDFGWSYDTSRGDPCSEEYGGTEPWEAVEAAAIAEWARNQTRHDVDFVGLVDLHSYSQQVMFPFSYTCDLDPPNLENLEELAVGLAKAIRLSSGESYAVKSACEGAAMMGAASSGGAAIDWFYHEMRAHFSYQIKLRDTGSYGFLLPKEHIIPTGDEIVNAMKYLGDYLLGNNGIEGAGAHGSPSEIPIGQPARLELRRSRGEAIEVPKDLT